MTTPTTSGMSFVQAAALLAEHLAEHTLPEPVSLSVTTSYGDSMVTAQLRGTTLAGTAAALLAWTETLKVVTVEAWRPPQRDRVHLSLRGTLTGPTDAVELKVFGGVDYDPLHFAGLQPHPWRGESLSLGQLRTWAATTPAITGTPLLEAPRTGQ